MASSGMSPALRKKLETADRFFAAGDLRPAKMHADMAMAIFPDSPEAKRAHAAFRVLHAANAKITDHYAVLGVAAPLNGRPARETHEAIKSQHRALSDTLDPDKSSGSAAVAAAYKLVNEAFAAALTDIKKNEAVVGAAVAAVPPRRARLPPLRPKMPAAPAVRRVEELDEMMAREKHAAAATATATADPFFGELLVERKQQCAASEEEEDYYAGGRSRSGRQIPIVKY